MIPAEREGFEPPDPLRSTVFKTAAFDHSAISPIFSRDWDSLLLKLFPFVRDCKGTNIFVICKFFVCFFLKKRFLDFARNDNSERSKRNSESSE